MSTNQEIADSRLAEILGAPTLADPLTLGKRARENEAMSRARRLNIEIVSVREAIDALDSGRQISCPSCLARGAVASVEFPGVGAHAVGQNFVTVVVHHNELGLKDCEVKMSQETGAPIKKGDIEFLDCGECGRNEWHFEAKAHVGGLPQEKGYKRFEPTGEVSIHLKCIGCGNALTVKCRVKEKPTEA